MHFTNESANPFYYTEAHLRRMLKHNKELRMLASSVDVLRMSLENTPPRTQRQLMFMQYDAYNWVRKLSALLLRASQVNYIAVAIGVCVREDRSI